MVLWARLLFKCWLRKARQVRVLTRNRDRAKALTVLPTVEVVETDIHDQVELNRQFEGMDAVINLVGVLHEIRHGRVDKPSARRGDFHENHVELPRKVLHACAANGIQRVLHMSALGADPTSRSAYQRSKGVGEALMRESAMPNSENERWYLDGPKFIHGYGMYTTIFRPSVIFGRVTVFCRCSLAGQVAGASACQSRRAFPAGVGGRCGQSLCGCSG
jgi:Predicted nucleoside-diphosphate-sugar epimerases